ncbi:MAG: response regulator transcription factor [Porticoccaceae bacterium]
MTEPADFLIIDDDDAFSAILARSLARRGFTTATAHDDATALAFCTQTAVRRIVLDLKLEQSSGLNLIGRLREVAPNAQIVILTGYSSIPTTVEAIKLGAINYLCKPASVDDIIDAFENCTGNPDVELPHQPHSVERLEWEHIQRVLSDNGGNISATARALGMHRRTLQRKLQKRPVRN